MTPCVVDMAGVTLELALCGLALALVVTALYVGMVRFAYYREHNARRRAWHDREK